MTDVVVVGAGMAGLTCAADLRAGGLDVVVLEATDRPGGRVRTVRFGDGSWVESGGEWIDTAHRNVHELLERHGLRTVGDGAPWWEREAGWIDDADGLRPVAEAWGAGARVREDLGRYDDLLEVYAREIHDPEAPELHPQAEIVDASSASELHERLELGEEARFFLGREIAFEYSCDPDEISALFLAQQRAMARREEAEFGDIRSQRVEGGLSRLAGSMAEEQATAIRFATPLTGVSQDADGVIAATPSGNVRASHLVLTTTLVAARAMTFDPPLDGPFGRGVRELGYGAVVKTFVRYARRPWPFVWATTRRFLQRVYDATEEQPGLRGVLDAYMGAAEARAFAARQPDEAARVAEVRDELARMLPELATADLEGASRAWELDRWFGGSFAVYRPGQVTGFWRALREPHGRLHLAGEHVATVTGYVEGAVESGHRVADRILRGPDRSEPALADPHEGRAAAREGTR